MLIGNRASEAAVRAIPVPPRTRSYNPIAYGDVIDMVETTAGQYDMSIIDRGFALGKDGGQLFAVWQVEGSDAVGDARIVRSIGMRQSYNKTLALGGVAGATVMVCSNLDFSGSDFRQVRKNTTNVWDDFRSIVERACVDVEGAYARSVALRGSLEVREISDRKAYALLGIAQGEGVLKPQQITEAFRQWNRPAHEEFAPRNAWSFYNAMTEAAKRGPAGGYLGRGLAVNAFARRAFGAPAVLALPDA